MTIKFALTQKGIESNIKSGKDGKFRDGAGLQLEMKGSSRQWFLAYSWEGRQRMIVIGKFPVLSLPQARTKAGELRAAKAAGIDPRAAFNAVAAPTQPIIEITFRDDLNTYFEKKHREWDAYYAHQWKRQLERHAASLMSLATSKITDADLMVALKTLWSSHNRTADDVLARVRGIIDYAASLDPQRFPNPNPCLRARLLLPYGLTPQVINHAAMSIAETPAFYARLAARPEIAARALQFLLLNGTPRADEVRLATWGEIAGDKWHIPRDHIKEWQNQRAKD
jgi:hypothetical protein